MRLCTECSSEVAEHDTFCPFCGLTLQAAEPAPIEPVEEAITPAAEPPADDFDSTIMMSPDEAAALAAQAKDSGLIDEPTDIEPNPSDDHAAAAVPDEPLETVGPEVVTTDVPETPEVVDEPVFVDDVPEPQLLRDERKTSEAVEMNKTAEHFAAKSVEIVSGSLEIGDLDATLIGMPPALVFDIETAAPEPERPSREEPEELSAEPEPVESKPVVADAVPEPIEKEPSATESVMSDVELSSEPISDPVPPAMVSNEMESQESESSPAPEAVSTEEPTPVADEIDAKMISMPHEQLDLPDPFAGNSMFDSVRIIEGQFPIPADQTDARISRTLDPGGAGLDVPAESEQPKPQTASGIGSSDTDGRRSSKLKPLSEGTVLNGRYEIVRKIGGGGMGAVYLASDNNLGGVLRAVKEMVQSHIEDDQQEKAIADFKRESMILSSLDHSSIPTIFDYFFDDSEGRFYLVMKYISGGDLSSRLRSASEGKIEERKVVEWGIQITEVLDYLHNQPSAIVYRDLKPSNIMIDGNSDRVMLIDFGIARSISQKEEKGVTAVGTMGYAPPELFSGNVEPRSDIYSLGSTMFHLMTGADPQSNPLLIFDFQKNPRPRQINPRLSDQIESILMRCVEYNADARFISAAELKAALESHLELLESGRITFGTGNAPVSVSFSSQQVFCGFCGQKIVATDMFCAFCGAKQPIAQQGVHSEIYSNAAKTARLVIEGTTELATPTYLLQKDENLVGRRDPMSNIFPEVDLSKFDPQTKISRRHARIWRDGTVFRLEDLGSSNGTTVSVDLNEPLRLVPHRPHPLANGDKIKIGDTVLHFILN